MSLLTLLTEVFDMEYWTLEAFENDSTKDITIDDKGVKIKALDPKVLILLMDGKEGLVSGQQDTKTLLQNIELMEDVCVYGLVSPAITKETVGKLGRHQKDIAEAILKFSGLSKDAEAATETFRKEPDGSNG